MLYLSHVPENKREVIGSCKAKVGDLVLDRLALFICSSFSYADTNVSQSEIITNHLVIERNTENPRYNDSVCYQRFCCKIEFTVIHVKKLDMDPSEAWIMDIFEQFFYKSYVFFLYL